MPRSHVARILEQMVLSEGTQQKLVAKTGGRISRPLITQILNGKAGATTAAVAALCRACESEQARRLLTAYLEDELAGVLKAYRSESVSGWDGQLSTALTITPPTLSPSSDQSQGRFVIDANNMSCFQVRDVS